MWNPPSELPESEAIELLGSYPKEKHEITAELAVFGKMLMDMTNQRAASLDAKATSIVGYSIALLAFLVANAKDWTSHLSAGEKLLALPASLSIFVAIVAGGWAMRAQRWAWFSAKDWIRREILVDVETQRRYYLSVAQKVHRRNERVNESKACAVVTAQMALACGGVLLALVLVLRIVS